MVIPPSTLVIPCRGERTPPTLAAKMHTSGRSFVCPVMNEQVAVVTLLERRRMGLPPVRTFVSCSGMSACLDPPQDPADLISTPELCPLRLSLE